MNYATRILHGIREQSDQIGDLVRDGRYSEADAVLERLKAMVEQARYSALPDWDTNSG